MRPIVWTLTILLITVLFCLAAEQTVARAGQKWTVFSFEIIWIATATTWLLRRVVAKDWPKLPIIW